jgi:hypothetical protein
VMRVSSLPSARATSQGQDDQEMVSEAPDSGSTAGMRWPKMTVTAMW